MDDIGTENQGRVDRRLFLLAGEIMDLYGHVPCDFFNQDKLFFNSVEHRVRKAHSEDAFCLMNPSNNPYLGIKEAYLIRSTKISPGVFLEHATAPSQGTAKYSVTRIEVKRLTIHSGGYSETLDSVIRGQLLRGILLNAQLDCSGGKLYFDAFHTLLSEIGVHFLNEGNYIDSLNYANGYGLFALYLTSDISVHCHSH